MVPGLPGWLFESSGGLVDARFNAMRDIGPSGAVPSGKAQVHAERLGQCEREDHDAQER